MNQIVAYFSKSILFQPGQMDCGISITSGTVLVKDWWIVFHPGSVLLSSCQYHAEKKNGSYFFSLELRYSTIGIYSDCIWDVWVVSSCLTRQWMVQRGFEKRAKINMGFRLSDSMTVVDGDCHNFKHLKRILNYRNSMSNVWIPVVPGSNILRTKPAGCVYPVQY